ncbi:hypothetical protein GF325_14480 [Candidatus Bathyarchaeota archaeon]|nr:hypothetical protein [Candidatus Bathyarchaeota archaeon]
MWFGISRYKKGSMMVLFIFLVGMSITVQSQESSNGSNLDCTFEYLTGMKYTTKTPSQSSFNHPGTILINEVCNRGTRGVELINYGSVISMNGWTFRCFTESGIDINYSFPAGFMLPSESFLVLHEGTGNDSLSDLFIDDIFPFSGEPVALGIFNDRGLNVDWMDMNGYDLPIPLEAIWTESKNLSLNQNNVCRLSDTDTHDSGDWMQSFTNTLGFLNEDQEGYRPLSLQHVEPAPGSSFPAGIIDFRWASTFSFGIEHDWTLQLSNISNFSTVMATCNATWQDGLHHCLLNVSSLDPGTYYWRVGFSSGYHVNTWSNSFPLEILPNLHAPVLENLTICRNGSTTADRIRITIKYKDADNLGPRNLNLATENYSMPMEKLDVLDENYMDGCIYYVEAYFQPGVHHCLATAHDGIYESTVIVPELVVTYSNTMAPILEPIIVEPFNGSTDTTEFTFSVNYKDGDNNPPEYVHVLIGPAVHPMYKRDPSDCNYMDGCMYEIKMDIETPGNYTHAFACSDGIYTTMTDLIEAPAVVDKFIPWYHVGKHRTADISKSLACEEAGKFFTCTSKPSTGEIIMTCWNRGGEQAWNVSIFLEQDIQVQAMVAHDGHVYVACDDLSNEKIVLIRWTTTGFFAGQSHWLLPGKQSANSITTDGTKVFIFGTTVDASLEIRQFLACCSLNGTLDWYRQGSNGFQEGRGICTDGEYLYTCSYDSQGLNGIHYQKWTLEGAELFSWFIMEDGRESANDICVKDDDVYITGSVPGSSGMESDYLLVKTSTDGSPVVTWYRTWGSQQEEQCVSVNCDENAIYIVGNAIDTNSRENRITVFTYGTNGTRQMERVWNPSMNVTAFNAIVAEHSLFITGAWCAGMKEKEGMEHRMLFFRYPLDGNFHPSQVELLSINSGKFPSGNLQVLVSFRDLDGSQPQQLRLWIDHEIHAFTLSHENGDPDFTRGVVYEAIARVEEGSHDISFQYHDGWQIVSSPTREVIIDTNQDTRNGLFIMLLIASASLIGISTTAILINRRSRNKKSVQAYPVEIYNGMYRLYRQVSSLDIPEDWVDGGIDIARIITNRDSGDSNRIITPSFNDSIAPKVSRAYNDLDDIIGQEMAPMTDNNLATQRDTSLHLLARKKSTKRQFIQFNTHSGGILHLTRFYCSKCSLQLLVKPLEGSCLYSCKTCGELFSIIISCKKCGDLLLMKQSKGWNAANVRVTCPTCHETCFP